ncbi:MAG: hypothetical protein KY439_07790, partial [Actinobacteria bacterium]|nr:hypothetical protein [Actinomycetota bacterium]
MDEAGREDGPAGAGWREEGPDVGHPAPALLQELAALDRAQEVVACAGEPAEPEDEEVPARPRVRTSTKVVLVVGAWLLLTLFLVGRFSGGPVPEGSARLDQAATGDEEDEAAAEGEEASGEESSGDGSEELAVGELVAGGGTYGDGTAIAGADPVAGGAGGGAVYAGIPAEASAGVGGGGAVPGAAPGSPGSTAVAPGSGGGSTTTAPSAG